MKKEKGITLVSLVVTIIILIILAGVSINLTLGKNGIITMAKQAKENTELAKIEEETALNELYKEIESEGGTSGDISYDAIAKLTEFKTAIANYIEEAGGVKPETEADTETFGESIKGILKEATKDATATAEDIAEGKTAYVNGEKITGTMTNNGAISKTINAGETYTIPLGYHNGNGKITASAANNLENLTLVVANGSNSFTSTVGKKYLVFTITTMYQDNATASLSGATILSSKTIANPTTGTHGSGVIFICTATSTTISFNGGNPGKESSIAYMELN